VTPPSAAPQRSLRGLVQAGQADARMSPPGSYCSCRLARPGPAEGQSPPHVGGVSLKYTTYTPRRRECERRGGGGGEFRQRGPKPPLWGVGVRLAGPALAPLPPHFMRSARRWVDDPVRLHCQAHRATSSLTRPLTRRGTASRPPGQPEAPSRLVRRSCTRTTPGTGTCCRASLPGPDPGGSPL